MGKEGWVEESSLGSGLSLPSPGESGDGDKKVTGSIGLPAPETEPFSVTFLVNMTGPPARKFRLSCRYITERGREMRMKRASIVPKSYKLKGKAIRCTMRAEPGVETKRLRMEILGDGERLGVAYLGDYYSYTLYSPWDWD